MKIEKFKVLLYLKKSGMDKNGKAPIMGRITVNRTMAQFSCKLSCTPSLWNPRASRLEGKSKEAVETNKDIEQLLLSIQKAFDVLVEKRTDLPVNCYSLALFYTLFHLDISNMMKCSIWATFRHYLYQLRIYFCKYNLQYTLSE